MFHTDKPIISHNEDLFQRKNFAKNLAKSIINMSSGETFTLGLFGKWGTGKTSLINMMVQEIDEQQQTLQPDDKIMIVHFNPWNFSDANQLITQFFIHLSNRFSGGDDKKRNEIGKALERYSDAFELAKLIPGVGNVLAFGGKKIFAGIGKKLQKDNGEKDILKQKEHIIQLLEKQKNRILIIIDDIDRLSNEQIRQIFQLITSVAKFPNITYLLAFDKEIVVKALEKVQEGRGEDYLEKVIQMPINISDIQKNDLRDALINRLNKIISMQSDAVLNKEHWQEIFGHCIEPFVNNLRDINRLCNIVQFKLLAIASEVDFADVVAISVLEIVSPKIYDWVKDNRELLTGNDISEKFVKKSQTEWLEFYKRIFCDVLKVKDQSGADKEIEEIINFLSRLFPYFGQKVGKIYVAYDMDKLRANNQIAHPDKCDRYFHLNIDGVRLKKADVLKAVHFFDVEGLKHFLLFQEKNGTSDEFFKELKAMYEEISAERAKIIVTAILQTSACLRSVSDMSILTIPVSQFAEHVAYQLIEKTQSDERVEFLLDNIANGDINSLQPLANLLNMIELGYGRLAANGVERDYTKIVSLEELIKIEDAFCSKIKQVLEISSLFEFKEWRMIYYLIESFDASYLAEYLQKAFEDDSNILRFLEYSITVWIGGDNRYEVKNDYEKYLSEERVIDAIESQLVSRKIFDLPKEIQHKTIAFYLIKVGKKTDVGQKEVEKFLVEHENIS